MSVAVDCPSLFQVARCWATLLLVPVLAGCAMGSSGRTSSAWRQEVSRFDAPRSAAPWQGVLLAMSDGPAAGGESPGSTVQGYNVPGRKPDSQMPWELFLGGASHRIIAYMYGVNHPNNRVYFNTKALEAIVDDTGVGDVSLLRPDERMLRPDITDTFRRVLFEIKPWHEQGLQEGRVEVQKYLVALNRTILVGRPFMGGTDFSGEILIRFAGGRYIWRLEWTTSEPGVVQYRWTRSQQPFDSEAAAYKASQWVDLTESELRQYGGWVEKAVEGMISRREKLATVSGTVGMVIDLLGGVATTVLWSSILGQMGADKGSQQPPAQGGGRVIPFPTKTPPVVPPAQMPAAAGMSLPR